MNSAFMIGVKNTHSKIWLRWKYRICAVLVAVAAVWSGLQANLGRNFVASDFAISMAGNHYSMLEALNLFWIPLICFMLAADFFATEIADGSIKFEALRPIGRSSLYLSKAGGMFLYCAEQYLGAYLIHAVVSIVLGGVYALPMLFVATLMSLLVALAFVALASFISNLLGHPSLAMFVMILVYALMLLVGRVFPAFGVFFFTTSINWYKMIMGTSITWSSFFASLAMLLSIIGLTGAGGQWLFDRRDLG